jgi:hypothetical protein
MSDVLKQLRAVADGRSSAPDKELHPDAGLLRACATHLDLRADAAAIEREARGGVQRKRGACIGNPEFDAARVRWREKEAEAKRVLNRLGRMQATTAAGVYAKATIVVVQKGYMSAPRFMLSLATDLVGNPTLRASLWPTEVA